MRLDFTDDLRGTIVGGSGTYYEFWHVDIELNRLIDTPGKSRRIGRGVFSDDGEAESYCRENFPAQYGRGIEMRAFN